MWYKFFNKLSRMFYNGLTNDVERFAFWCTVYGLLFEDKVNCANLTRLNNVMHLSSNYKALYIPCKVNKYFWYKQADIIELLDKLSKTTTKDEKYTIIIGFIKKLYAVYPYMDVSILEKDIEKFKVLIE